MSNCAKISYKMRGKLGALVFVLLLVLVTAVGCGGIKTPELEVSGSDVSEETEVIPTASPSLTVTGTPTPVPTATQAPTVTPSPTPSPTTIPSPTELPTATPAPTVTPTSIPSPTELLTATPSPTILPPEEAAFQIAVMENDTVCLERVRDTRATEIVIPGYIGKKRVVQVEAEIFTGCKALTTVRLRDDVEPEPELFIELVTAALRCMKLREIYLPAGYEQYLTEELHLDKVKGITVAKEDNSMVIRLQTSLLFLAPKVIELMQQYQ